MAMLQPLGIAKGERFTPDGRLRTILLEGAAMGELMACNLQVNPCYAKPLLAGHVLVQELRF